MDSPILPAARGDDEAARLKRTLRDLVALSVLPAMSTGFDAVEIARSLGAVLAKTLSLDVVYFRIATGSHEHPIEIGLVQDKVVARDEAARIGRLVAPLISDPFALNATISHPAGVGELAVAATRFGFGETGGVVVAGASRKHFPTTDERLLLGVVGNQVAIAVRRGRVEAERQILLEREREAREEAETMNDLSRYLVAELDVSALLQKVTDAGTELTRAEFGAFFYNSIDEHGAGYLLYALSGARREQFAGFGMPRATDLFAPTFRGEGPVRIDDVLLDPRYGKNPPHEGMPRGHLPVRSYLAVPVTSRTGEVFGGLFYGHPGVARFGAREERVLLGIASQAAIAIDNARLFGRAQAEIAERKHAEEVLRESEARFRNMADHAPVMIWVTDAAGKPQYASASWYAFTGTPADCVDLPKAWADSLHPDDRKVSMGGRPAAIGAPREYRVRRNDGQYRFVREMAAVRHGDGGEILGTVGSIIDITEQKALEADRAALLEGERAARIDAERSARARDEFLAVLSHELRTPLNGVLGWIQLLKRDLPDPAIRAEAFDAIERGTRAQARLIEDLLDTSRIISGKLRLEVQSVDLVAIIHAAVDTMRPAANAKEIRIDRVLDPLAGPVKGDPARLQQVLWNLLSNAVKFTPKHGRIQIHLERVNSHLELRVSDNGIGISADNLPHIFDRFQQVESATVRRSGGLGLGLAIVKYLVELHGGQVAAQSGGENQGATFCVSLPVAIFHDTSFEREHPVAPREIASDPFEISLAGLRILVVDDDPDTCIMLHRVLVQCGAEVATANSARAAIDLVASMNPDIIVSDIGMADMDGYDLMRELRARGTRTPAIAVTAFARAEDRIRALRAGYNMHIAKPLEPSELITVIATLANSRAG